MAAKEPKRQRIDIPLLLAAAFALLALALLADTVYQAGGSRGGAARRGPPLAKVGGAAWTARRALPMRSTPE